MIENEDVRAEGKNRRPPQFGNLSGQMRRPQSPPYLSDPDCPDSVYGKYAVLNGDKPVDEEQSAVDPVQILPILFPGSLEKAA